MVAHHPGRPSAAGLATTGGCGKFDCDYYLAFRSSLAAGLPSLGSNPIFEVSNNLGCVAFKPFVKFALCAVSGKRD